MIDPDKRRAVKDLREFSAISGLKQKDQGDDVTMVNVHGLQTRPAKAPCTPRLSRLLAPRGITLVEMMVVVSVVGLMIALIGTTLSDVRQRMRMNEATNAVANLLLQVRSRAIDEHTVYHLRVQNNPPPEELDEDGFPTGQISQVAPPVQFLSVFQFTRTADALKARTEEDVWTQVYHPQSLEYGWNPYEVSHPDFTNILIERIVLPSGTWFETEYDPSILFDPALKRLMARDQLHPNAFDETNSSLFYSGGYDNKTLTDPNFDLPFLLRSDSFNALPKAATYDASGKLVSAANQVLLYFNPDGTASSTAVFLVRDHSQLGYVQVLRSGQVRSGLLLSQQDFKQLKF